jgi:hypothetical protein
MKARRFRATGSGAAQDFTSRNESRLDRCNIPVLLAMIGSRWKCDLTSV